MTNEQIDTLRRQALEMINKVHHNVQSTRRGHSKPWRKDLQVLITQLILSTKMSKGEMLRNVKQQLKTKWTKFADDIEKIKARDLLDCVKSLTLNFLKTLRANPPKATSWYPDKAVAMAYCVCRYTDLNSSFKALCNHLNRRRSQLTPIPIPCAGIMFVCVIIRYLMYAQQNQTMLPNFYTLFDPIVFDLTWCDT